MIKKRKKFTASLLSVALILQFCLYSSAASQEGRNISNFRDISQDEWYYVYVKRLYEDGIINGVTNTSYSPNAAVKTNEVAALIARYLGNEHLAVKSREYLIKNKTEGAELWYSGYIQLLCDMGIFDSSDIERCGIRLTASGGAEIPKESAASIDSPIKRMDMVKLIARSFEIKKGKTKANGLLKKEISGNGNEFINGGGYDDESLQKIGDMITDYNNIPYEYKMFFLKCYYNGIVRGNERGEVLPYDNLRRSELAKIIAAVLYFDLRGNEIRDIPELCVIKPGDYSVSSTDGRQVLKKEKADLILKEQAKNIKTENVNNILNITVNQKNIIPAGYLNEIYIYRYDGGTTYEVGKVNCASNTNEYFPKDNSFSISKAGKSTNDLLGYVYIILRDLTRGGEVAGAIMLNIDFDGNLKYTQAYYLP